MKEKKETNQELTDRLNKSMFNWWFDDLCGIDWKQEMLDKIKNDKNKTFKKEEKKD